MYSFRKNWFKAEKATRIWIVIIYAFVTFTIPLTHTCSLHAQNSTNCNFGSHHCCCGLEDQVCMQPTVIVEQSSCTTENRHCNGLCTACMYSMNSRSTSVQPGAVTLDNEFQTFTQSLQFSNVVIRHQWATSIILRGPPLNIS